MLENYPLIIQQIKKEALIDARFLLFSLLLSSYLSLYFTSMYLLMASAIFTLWFFSKSYKKPYILKYYSFFLSFCFVWVLMIFLFKSINWSGNLFFENIEESFIFAFYYVLKLYLLGLIAFCAYFSTSAREYALAVSWFASFFSKKHAHILGLLLLLVLKFFQDIFKIFMELKQNVSYKFRNTPQVSSFRKITICMKTLIFLFVKRIDELSIALFSKKLSEQEKFEKKWQKIYSKSSIQSNFIYFLLLVIMLLFYFLSV